MTIIYFSLALIFISLGIVVSKALYSRILSPVSAYTVPFGLVFVLLCLPIIEYRPLSLQAVLALLLSMLALIFGAFVGAVFSGRQIERGVILYEPHKLTVKVRLFLFLTYSLASLGLLLQLYYMARYFGGIARIIEQPTLIYHVRVTYGFDFPSWVGYLVSLSYCGIFLTGCYAVLVGWRNLYSVWTVLIVAGIALSSMGRASILWAALLIFNGAYLTGLVLGTTRRFHISFRRIVVFLALAGLVIAATMYLRLIRAQDNFESTEARIYHVINPALLRYDSTVLRGLIQAYLSFSGPVPAFGEHIDYPEKRLGLGVKTFNALFRMVNPAIARYGPIHESSYLPGFNVFTALDDWFYDFGWAGIFLIPFLVGILSSWLFRKAIQRTISLWQLGLLAFLFLWLEWAIFFSMTYQGFFLIDLGWLFILSHLPMSVRKRAFSASTSRLRRVQ